MTLKTWQEAADAFGIGKASIHRRCRDAGLKTPTTVAEVHRALSGGMDASETKEAAQLRKWKAEADLKEIEVRKVGDQLLDADEVFEESSARVISARREIQSWHDISRERRSELSRKLGDALGKKGRKRNADRS